MLAAKVKLNAPYCHTYLEIIKARWGTFGHLTFLFFGLATNVIVSLMLVLGGSATVADLTGMHTIAACFLIPIAVSIYVIVGGMRATLIADYSHTLVLYCILISFCLIVYGTSDIIGSPSKMYAMLQTAGANNPISGNAGGSYLTMRSKSGLIFGVLNIVGNFGTVFNDQAYWQRAIASRPHTAVKGFLAGGLAWFAIPLAIATSLGLSAVALAHSDNPLIQLTADEVSAGLPAVKAIAALAGKSGATAMLILLFLAVTSAASAEQIAVSSLFTYDVYGTYINKKPTEKQILYVSHCAIIGFALFMGAIATAFNYIGVSMGYLYELMGTIIGCAVVPIALCITWKKTNGTGAICGAILGFVAGVAGWIGITAHLNNGVITVDTTFGDYEMLTGNLLSIGVGGIITVGWSLISPADFDWDITRAINVEAGRATEAIVEHHVETADIPSEDSSVAEVRLPSGSAEKDKSGTATPARGHAASNPLDIEALASNEDVSLKKAFRLASYAALILTFILIFAVPMPQFFSHYIYPEKGFTAWVCIVIMWLFCGLLAVGVYPVFEARHGLAEVGKGMWADISRKGK